MMVAAKEVVVEEQKLEKCCLRSLSASALMTYDEQSSTFLA
jgi:hypothetical protein